LAINVVAVWRLPPKLKKAFAAVAAMLDGDAATEAVFSPILGVLGGASSGEAGLFTGTAVSGVLGADSYTKSL
jgi:hypothetical protein